MNRSEEHTSELQDALEASNELLQAKEDELRVLQFQQDQSCNQIYDLSNQLNHLECELASDNAQFHLERQSLLTELQSTVAKFVATEMSVAQLIAELEAERLKVRDLKDRVLEMEEEILKLNDTITSYDMDVRELHSDAMADKEAQTAVIAGLNEMLESLQQQLQEADEEIAANNTDLKMLVKGHGDRLSEVNALLVALTQELNESRALLDAKAHSLIDLRGSLSDQGDRKSVV